MSSKDYDILIKSEETLKNTRIVMDDMMQNRGEYNSKDLAWRNLEISNGILTILEDVVPILKSVKNTTEDVEDETIYDEVETGGGNEDDDDLEGLFNTNELEDDEEEDEEDDETEDDDDEEEE